MTEHYDRKIVRNGTGVYYGGTERKRARKKFYKALNEVRKFSEMSQEGLRLYKEMFPNG